MISLLRPMILFLLLSVTLFAAEDRWIPERIPTTSALPFLFYYQQFLQANPFAIDHRKNTPEQHAENRRRHQRAAELYAAMANTASLLTQSEGLLPTAPEGIKKEKSEKIHGTWNLYQNVPINAADLREESLWMSFTALSHEVSLDSKKITLLHDFAVGLNADAAPTGMDQSGKLLSLFQYVNRSVCLRALSFAYNPLKDHADDPKKPIPSEAELEKRFSLALSWFLPFVQQFPSEENIKLVDAFFDTMELFQVNYPDSAHSPIWVKSFQQTFAAIANQHVKPLILEYIDMYSGILRRWDLLGKPMPLWGTDLSGKNFDDKTLEGKVVLLDFWATWCGPCIAEFPHLKLLYQKYKDKGFEIVGYSVDADREVLQKYLERNPLPWIVLSKVSTSEAGLPPLSLYYGAKSLPVVLLRDRSGNAVMLDARGEMLDEILETLLK